MAHLKAIAIAGGISTDSINKRLLGFLRERAAAKIDIDFFDITSLPYFSQDLEEKLPESVRAFKTRIEASDGALFVTPEYNRSFPGVLKNAIDWGSRPWGQNSWKGKPAGILGASVGAIGTFGAQRHLRHVLAYLDMPVMMQPEYYLTMPDHLDGDRLDVGATEFLDGYIAAYAVWLEKLRK